MLKRIENVLNEINCYELTEMVEADIDYKNAKTYNEQRAVLICGIQSVYEMFTQSGNAFYDDLVIVTGSLYLIGKILSFFMNNS